MNLNRPNKYSFQNSKQEGILYCFFFNKTKQDNREQTRTTFTGKKIYLGRLFLFYHFKTKKMILLTQYFVNDTVIGRNYIGDILGHPQTVIFF